MILKLNQVKWSCFRLILLDLTWFNLIQLQNVDGDFSSGPNELAICKRNPWKQKDLNTTK